MIFTCLILRYFSDIEYLLDMPVKTICWENSTCRIIDQTELPDALRVITIASPQQMFEAIKSLRVRGAPVYVAKEQGKRIKVFADEMRPLLQGARLTTWELIQNDIEVTLIRLQ